MEGDDPLRRGYNIINRKPRKGQTDLRNIPAGNHPDSKRQYTDDDRARQRSMLKTSIKQNLGKHKKPNLPENTEIDEASCKTMKEAEMTDKQMKKREEIVKSMKKNKSGFEKRYGERAKNVMYATATKMAQKEGFELDEDTINELGLGTLFSYGMKRLGQAMKGNLPPKKSPEVHAKNLERASDKLSDKKYVQTPTPKDNVVPLKKEEVELDEISAETKASYKKKAGEEVKQLQPHAKKGEYKDLAKNLIAKRKKGIEKADK
jgi:hypothetical protein